MRILPLDGRKRDENDYQFSTRDGMGLAHWEGDTLVIESVGFSDTTWLGWEGYFHTDKMELPNGSPARATCSITTSRSPIQMC